MDTPQFFFMFLITIFLREGTVYEILFTSLRKKATQKRSTDKGSYKSKLFPLRAGSPTTPTPLPRMANAKMEGLFVLLS